jgi:teichoic acid transport system ATP-binding protein
MVDPSGARHVPPVVVADDVYVTYQVYEDSPRNTVKTAFAQALRPRTPRRVEAVKGVSFTLHEGEALGLIGANGSGKSSLLRAIAGLQPMTSGRVFARSEPVLLGVGAALHPDLSGRRNVLLGCTALGMPGDEALEALDEIVRFAEVEEFVDMPLRTYSSGMSARLQFAIASAVEPDVLLIDEALAVGDASFRRKSEQRMLRLVQNAGGLVLVSHSSASIAAMCDRAIWLVNGEVAADGPVGSVLEAYAEHSGGA